MKRVEEEDEEEKEEEKKEVTVKMAVALRILGRGCTGHRPITHQGTFMMQWVLSKGYTGIIQGKRPIVLQGSFMTQWSRAIVTTSSSSAMKVQSAEDFWSKNKRLRRPVSPHLTIYKPQLTWMLSFLHRASGITLSVMLSGVSIGMLALPNSYPYYLDLLQSLQFGGFIIFSSKFLLALPFMYHLTNGIRHLVWDLGYGFTLRTLYKTGYIVLGLSLLLSAGVAAM